MKENMFPVNKIVTHAGQFHADEVFAIGLLRCVFPHTKFKVERKRTVDPEDTTDKCITIDVGHNYDPVLLNFDHHQDETRESSNMLILDFLYSQGYIKEGFYKDLFGPFSWISKIDRGGFGKNTQGFQTNSLIKAFNYVENGFDLAVNLATEYCKGLKGSTEMYESSKDIWKNRTMVNKGVAVLSTHPLRWRKDAEAGVAYIVFPEPENNTWKVNSFNSAYFPIESTGEEKFLHNQKFIGVYYSKESAIKAAVISYEKHAKLTIAM